MKWTLKIVRSIALNIEDQYVEHVVGKNSKKFPSMDQRMHNGKI